MSLKELTAQKHKLAESTPFMKAVFANTLPKDLWVDFIAQKTAFYSQIEMMAKNLGLLEKLTGIERAYHLYNDFSQMKEDKTYNLKMSTLDYMTYLSQLNRPKLMLAHLYTWHMGDMFGGQMIKKLIDAPHSHLDFDNMPQLMATLREMLDDSIANEANVAFDWAIRILNEYDVS
jgi:heme oxygenase